MLCAARADGGRKAPLRRPREKLGRPPLHHLRFRDKTMNEALDPNANESFWESRYANAAPQSSGRPSAALVQYAEPMSAGTALDLGCSRGDDAVWLAKRRLARRCGGRVRHGAALRCCQRRERRSRRSHRLSATCLSATFPEGGFDLISAIGEQSQEASGPSGQTATVFGTIVPIRRGECPR